MLFGRAVQPPAGLGPLTQEEKIKQKKGFPKYPFLRTAHFTTFAEAQTGQRPLTQGVTHY